MILVSASPRAYVGGALFAASLILLYGTSAAYHLIDWKPALRRMVRRLDHSMIFVLIVGTYSPFCLVAVGRAWGISILSVVGGLAAFGMLLQLVRPAAPRWLGVAVYVGLGWVALAAASEILAEISAVAIFLLILGGVAYSLGGAVYAARRPNLFLPAFGFHELFHLLVITASAIHYSVIAIYILPS